MVGREAAFEAAAELVGVGREARRAAGVEEGASGVGEDSCHGVEVVMGGALISCGGDGIGGFGKRFRNCSGGWLSLCGRSLKENHCDVDGRRRRRRR